MREESLSSGSGGGAVSASAIHPSTVVLGCWEERNQNGQTKRNRLEHRKLHDLVYIKYNQALKAYYNMRNEIDSTSLIGIDTSKEWLHREMDDAENDLDFGNDNLTWNIVEKASRAVEYFGNSCLGIWSASLNLFNIISVKFPEYRIHIEKTQCFAKSFCQSFSGAIDHFLVTGIFEIMLRKRTRSVQKDQQHMGHITISDANSDYYSQSHAFGRNIKSNPIFNVPRLFVGLGPKGLLDSDSVRSPTSPLDFLVLPKLGDSVRTPRSFPKEVPQRTWDCSKVGLSLIDSLEDCSEVSGKILRSSESRNKSISPRTAFNPPTRQASKDSFEASKSLPKNFGNLPYTRNVSNFHNDSHVVFEIGETYQENESFGKARSCSLDSCFPFKTLSGLTLTTTYSDSGNFTYKDITIQVSSPPHFIGGSLNSNTIPTDLNSNSVCICFSNEFMGSLSASEIELSEDYTCVTSHGPCPKTTHIYGDCILETYSKNLRNHGKNKENVTLMSQMAQNNGNSLDVPNQYPSKDFLSFCYHCKKKLEDGKDIYMYRGEKAFCSLTCRALEIMIDEELEKSNPSSENSPKPEYGEQLFETGFFTAT
ncbi:hypothetical protein L6164_024247 [Bauhinia variegata]|uniref:Uncharacterized protein n=1 Tax=Bauhinia variegata TaxID=167791 RepID=A0ACB9LYG1_BAUVA|nr:hypothetical protein L6164_024247 [Bauhinia variegata]